MGPGCGMISQSLAMDCSVGWHGQEQLNPLRPLARTEAAALGRSGNRRGGGGL